MLRLPILKNGRPVLFARSLFSFGTDSLNIFATSCSVTMFNTARLLHRIKFEPAADHQQQMYNFIIVQDPQFLESLDQDRSNGCAFFLFRFSAHDPQGVLS